MVDGTSGKRKRPRDREGKGRKQQQQQRDMERSRRKERKRKQREEDDAEEARIRELVFGKAKGDLLEVLGSEVSGQAVDQTSTSSPASSKRGERAKQNDEQSLWFEDMTGADAKTVHHDGEGPGAGRGGPQEAVVAGGNGDGPAWVDEDDASLKVDISAKNRLRKLRQSKREGEMTGVEFEKRLRNRYTNANVTTEWAEAAEEDALRVAKGRKASRRRAKVGMGEGDSSDEEEEDEEEGDDDMDIDAILRGSSALKGGVGGVLQPGFLNIARCKDANQQEPAKSVVRAVSFHPTGEMLLAGGFDKTLRLFQVDGLRNSKLHSIFFEDLPISNALFTAADQAIITGRRPFFYWCDVPTGKVQKVPRIFSSGRSEKYLEKFAASPDGQWLAFVGNGGYVLLLSNKTKQWAAEFKLNSLARAVTFTPDSKYLLASGADADVYKFDIRSRRCVLRFFNEGGTCTTAMSMSSSTSHRLTAIGSDSGVVNVYDDDALESERGVLRPTPLKALMSLTTPVTTAKFSPDGQMLAIASSDKRDALKIIHAPSCSPFTNWPTERTPIRHPYALDFSPGGGFLAVGNDRGCVLLYRLRHYRRA